MDVPAPVQLVEDLATSSEDDDVEGPRGRAVTTITTVTEAENDSDRVQGGVQVETITHTGTKAVHSRLLADGTISLRPIPIKGKSGKGIRATRRVTFTARTSHLDRLNPSSQQDTFRGFFVLFWIGMAFALAKALHRGWNDDRIIVGLSFGRFITEDAIVLAISDAVLVGSTVLSLLLVKLYQKRWLRYKWVGAVIQHVAQTLYLFTAVRWTFYREWQWVQSGFLTLHSLSMIMKIHSYCSTNGDLSENLLQAERQEEILEKVIAKAGGLEKAKAEAEAVWQAEGHESGSDAAPSNGTLTASGLGLSDTGNLSHISPSQLKPSSASPHLDPSTLRRRRSKRRGSAASDMSADLPAANGNGTHTEEKDGATTPISQESTLQLLSWHPNEEIAALAAKAADLRESLVSKGDAQVVWPANVTLANFVDYMLCPTLVYELEYPRTDKIRPLYLLEKVAATFGTFSLILIITDVYIVPVSPHTHESSFIESVLDLAFPFLINYLLIFFIIFDCILGFFAEITCFADRLFYEDFWNSTSFDEFSRRWNLPVHTFLLRHVYSSTIATYRLSKMQAAFVTFLLSALVHELVMAVVTKKIRLYLFASQMAQIPLIVVGRLKIMRRYPALGNLFFWLGLLSGFPLLAIGYLRY